MILHLDIETYSEHDLSKVGLYEYHRHPSTKLLCACWIVERDGKEIDRGHWRLGDERPYELLEYIARCDFVYAHNAEFEREGINNLTDWTHLYPEDMYCTMANAACYNYPLSLAKLGTALGIERPKDLIGAKLMKEMCAPAKDGTPANHSEENMDRLVEYCYRDVEAEVDIGHILTPMTEMQLTAYHSTMKMNEAGIPIDLDVVKAAIKTRSTLEIKADAAIRKITGTIGLDLIMSWQKLIQWLKEDHGITVKNVQEETLRNVLANNPPKAVEEVLNWKLDIAATSLKKYDAMANVAGLTGRCRGCHQFHGASTGRWAGRLIQPQNLPRPSGKLPHKDTRDEILGGNADVQMLKDALRGTIYAPEGKEFVCVDWANIEGRMLAWLSGETWKVQAFADGQDLYKVAYSKSFKVAVEDVDKDQRAIGKVQELALGYGGKHGSIEAFAPGKFTRKEQDSMIDGWRKSNSKIVKFWWDLERAFKKCVTGKNDFVQTVGHIRMKWSHKINGVLVMLPSGRCITYPNSKLKDFTLKVGNKQYEMESAIHYNTYKNGQWIEVNSYGPKLAENCYCRDTQVVTMDGLKPIDSITSEDLLWDGVEWVKSEGSIDKGEQEVGEWLGVRVTSDHMMTDGKTWKDVGSMDAESTSDCLKYGLSSAHLLSRIEYSNPKIIASYIDAIAGMKVVHASKNSMELPRVRDVAMLERELRELISGVLWTELQPLSGVIDIQELFLGVISKNLKRIRTTAEEVLRCINRGLTIRGSSSNTQEVCQSMTNKVWILIESIMMGITNQVIYDLPLEARMQTTVGRVFDYHMRVSTIQLRNSLRDSHLYIMAHLLSGITCRTTEMQNTSWQPIKGTSEVFDIVNSGPRNRFTILTNRGFIVTHNCTQGACACLMMEALRRIPNVIMSVHDEIVCEVDEGSLDLKDLEEQFSEVPSWAEGLPVDSEGWIGKYYRK